MKFVLFLVILVLASARVFEGDKSEDVDYFLNNDDAQYRAILFYNPKQKDNSTVRNIDRVQSIFEDTFDIDWKGDEWIKHLDSGAQLMRIDTSIPELAQVTQQYEVKTTPKIVVFDDFKIAVEEVADKNTYGKLKSYMDKTKGKYSSSSSSSSSKSSGSQGSSGSMGSKKSSSSEKSSGSSDSRSFSGSSSSGSSSGSSGGSSGGSSSSKSDPTSSSTHANSRPPVKPSPPKIQQNLKPPVAPIIQTPMYTSSESKSLETRQKCEESMNTAQDSADEAKRALAELKEEYQDYKSYREANEFI
jgi:hypothetical protein